MAKGTHISEPDAPAYIDRVSTNELAEAIEKREIDEGARMLIEAESRYINAWREKNERPPATVTNRTALCISGGGIRSATFSLGVLQALARHDLLKRFDYLSTVSGGGYIGSAVSWFLSQSTGGKRRFDTGSNFPFGRETTKLKSDSELKEPGGSDTASQRELLEYLRSHGSYLAPGNGIGLLSLVSVIVRAMAVTLVVWFLLASAVLYMLLDPNFTAWDFDKTTFLGVWILGVLAVAFAVYALATRLSGESNLSYSMRRFSERTAASLMVMALALIAIGLLPWVDIQIANLVGLGSGILGVGAASAVSYFIRSGATGPRSDSKPEKKRRISIGVVAPVASLLMLYGILLEAYVFAGWLRSFVDGKQLVPLSRMLNYDLQYYDWFWVPLILLLAMGIVGWMVNLNYISIHRYYRDRLMETFMPDVETALAGQTGPSWKANKFKLSALNVEAPNSPYHVINGNIILVGDESRLRRVRGGDSFSLSPLYCGSSATGWRRTADFMGNKLTLATAMAVSGAAASPNAGVGGIGVTRNKMVSLLMALLNLRLGFWAPNPDRERQIGYIPQHIDPGMQAIMPFGHSSHTRFVEISDGGHFENLGVYEMIRRRVSLIVAIDAGADEQFAFNDLQNMAQKVREDFGVRFRFRDGYEPYEVIPDLEHAENFPQGAPLSVRAHADAEIIYPDAPNGRFILLKSTVTQGLDITVRGYKNANRAFPDESTANQFFTPLQVEAYRRLGDQVADLMICDPEMGFENMHEI